MSERFVGSWMHEYYVDLAFSCSRCSFSVWFSIFISHPEDQIRTSVRVGVIGSADERCNDFGANADLNLTRVCMCGVQLQMAGEHTCCRYCMQ